MDAVSTNLRQRTLPSHPSPADADDVATPDLSGPAHEAASGPPIYYPTRYVAAPSFENDYLSQHTIFRRATIIGTALLAVASAAILTWSMLSQVLEDWCWNRAEPQWAWDHNIYDPRGASSDEPQLNRQSPKLLILQHAISPQMAKILDLTSRVNRAYARHIEADYVRIDGPMALCDTLSDVIGMRIASEGAWLQYDAILAMDPDAIFVEFDTNVLDMLMVPDGHRSSLVGIAGNITDIDQHGSGVLFLNTRHQESSTVLKLWRDDCKSVHDHGLSSRGDVSILFDVLRKAYNQEELSSMVKELQPPQVDYFSGNVIKFFRKPSEYERMPRLQWLESDSEDMLIVLEQLIDSVCFKSYPKCELA